MDKPTAASAAATVIMNNEKTWPCNAFGSKLLNAIKLMFAALSISSIPINTMMAFLRVTTTKSPMQNKRAPKKSR